MDKIVQQFLHCFSIRYIHWDSFKYNTLEEQEQLLKMTINHPIVLKYPIDISYQVHFLKKIIDILENEGCEIHDDIYNTYCSLIVRSKQKLDYSYKHYKFSNQNSEIITLKESSKLVSNGTTGLCTWEASIALSEWCLRNKNTLKDKSIIELGSGIGLTSIVVNKFCEPKHIIATDCHPDVLDLLMENIEMNCHAKCKNNIDVLKMPWENINKNVANQSYDIVLAADVVYDPSVFSCLSLAFDFYLKSNPLCTIILACTIRNEKTIEDFINLLGRSMKINAVELNVEKFSHLDTTPNAKITIYELNLMKST